MPTLADQTEPRAKTEITPTRADFIRQNMNKDISYLLDKTGLSYYVIETIIEAEKNDYYKSYYSGESKFDKLTDEMVEFLLQANYETRKDLRNAFNRKFQWSELAPIHYQTLAKYKKKLESEREVENAV